MDRSNTIAVIVMLKEGALPSERPENAVGKLFAGLSARLFGSANSPESNALFAWYLAEIQKDHSSPLRWNPEKTLGIVRLSGISEAQIKDLKSREFVKSVDRDSFAAAVSPVEYIPEGVERPAGRMAPAKPLKFEIELGLAVAREFVRSVIRAAAGKLVSPVAHVVEEWKTSRDAILYLKARTQRPALGPKNSPDQPRPIG